MGYFSEQWLEIQALHKDGMAVSNNPNKINDL